MSSALRQAAYQPSSTRADETFPFVKLATGGMQVCYRTLCGGGSRPAISGVWLSASLAGRFWLRRKPR